MTAWPRRRGKALPYRAVVTGLAPASKLNSAGIPSEPALITTSYVAADAKVGRHFDLELAFELPRRPPILSAIRAGWIDCDDGALELAAASRGAFSGLPKSEQLPCSEQLPYADVQNVQMDLELERRVPGTEILNDGTHFTNVRGRDSRLENTSHRST
jgi:hypothetical protein